MSYRLETMIIGHEAILVDQFIKEEKNENGFKSSNMEDEMQSNDGR